MIRLPKRFIDIIESDREGSIKGATYLTQSRFNEVFAENNLYFFQEYTDHGWRHINSVLQSCDDLIPDETFRVLTKDDIIILVLATFLHDLGMHLLPLTFKAMVEGEYNDIIDNSFNDKPWASLWQSYIAEARKFNDEQRLNIFGDPKIEIKEPNLNNLGSLTNNDRMLIGEFIRRHHPRIASEIVFKGIRTNTGEQLHFFPDFNDDFRTLTGLLARSHGINIRDTFRFLKEKYHKIWKTPFNVHIIYLMALIRLADYFQIDSKRVLKIPYKTKLFQSPVSIKEHEKHLQTKSIQPSDDDPETLYILADPSNSNYFLALVDLFYNIQKELDTSWAVLGEVYGLKPYHEQPKLKYRRVQSNLDNIENDDASFSYVPENITFTVDREIPKLLVGPLYGYNPSFGIRELIQNSVDACMEREFREKKDNKIGYSGKVKVKIQKKDDNYVLSILDNGKGMTIEEIKNYFLKVGGSFRKNLKWQMQYIDFDGHSSVSKSGRFGIGVLAAYLLGSEIKVKTKSIDSKIGYSFSAELDQNQIEITKHNDMVEGTLIEILISSSMFESLVRMKGPTQSNSFEKESPRFDKWFYLNNPIIEYCIDNSDNLQFGFPILLNGINQEFDSDWQEIKSKEYKKVYWGYPKVSELRYKILCNGIFITQNYTIKDVRQPTIVVFDFDAKLPLSLDRSHFITNLPLVEEIKIDIQKNYIAKLLMTEVEDIFKTKNYVEIERRLFFHPSRNRWKNTFEILETLVYTPNGFLLDSPFFLNPFIGKIHLRLVEVKDKKSVNYPFERIDGLKFDLISFCKPQFKYYERNSIIYDYINSDNIIGWAGADNFSLFPKKGGVRAKYLEEIDIDSRLILLKEKVVFKNFYKDFSLFNLMSTLLGDDLVIPYTLEERKEKFKSAFDLLEGHMKKYE